MESELKIQYENGWIPKIQILKKNHSFKPSATKESCLLGNFPHSPPCERKNRAEKDLVTSIDTKGGKRTSWFHRHRCSTKSTRMWLLPTFTKADLKKDFLKSNICRSTHKSICARILSSNQSIPKPKEIWFNRH
jgi:hypothetical protein